MIKNIFSRAVFLIAVIGLAASCGKEGKIRKNLTGTWVVSTTTDDSVNVALAFGYALHYQFSDCKKKDEPCNGVYSISLGSLSSLANYTWTVKDDILTITPDSTTNLSVGTVRIDFTSDDAVTATDVNNSGKVYYLLRQ